MNIDSEYLTPLPQVPHHLNHGLIDLKIEALQLLAIFVGVIAYFLAWVLFWPALSLPSVWFAGCGVALLLFGASAGFVLRRSAYRLASQILIWSIFLAIVCVQLTFGSFDTAELFILPVIFSSVLLDRKMVFLVAGCAIVGMAFLVPQTGAIMTADVWISILIIVLVTVSAWLSANNLYVALLWFGNAFQKAQQNERTAREHQAELRRVLKTLDLANYRIERANYMLTVAREQAEEARRIKQHFVQNVSHELRTPLNLIVGFTELMTRSPEYYGSPLPPAYLRDMSVVYRNARHLQTLVNDVLDLSRIGAAQMSLQPETVDPILLVEESVATIRSLAEARGLALNVDFEPDLPLLWADATRMRQVLLNLISNAVRFTETGGVTVTVQCSAQEMLFSVRDTGPGIAPEDQQRVFEEFRQVDDSTRRKQGGVGLGLAISRQFVKLHGGRIWVESKVGEGSTFHFTVPIQSGDERSPIANARDPHRNAYNPDSQHGSILLCVTQNPAAATFLTNHIYNCRVLVANTVDQAQEVAFTSIPQAVVLDTQDEELTRADLRRLTELWRLPNVPFIAAPLPSALPHPNRLRVDGYLVKPVLQQNLWDTLRRLGEEIEEILLVDDDQDFVRLLRGMLSSAVRKYQVSSAFNGFEGLARIEQQPPDLVFLDLSMPGLTGFEVIERIRRNPAWDTVKIVVVSAQEELDQSQRINGPVLLGKDRGFGPEELVRWIQRELDLTGNVRQKETEPSED